MLARIARWPCPWARSARCARPSKHFISALFVPDAGARASWWRRSRSKPSARARASRRTARSGPSRPSPPCRARRRRCTWRGSFARAGVRTREPGARAAYRGPCPLGRAECDDRGGARLARRVQPDNHLVLRRYPPRPAAPRDRHGADPVMLEVFNNLLHVDRRADGRAAREHRPLGQHQGAAGFLLRPVRRRRATWSPTRRICPCTWAAWASRSRP